MTNGRAFASVGERILLTLWVGSLWSIGYLAVPTLFHLLDDRRLAGTLAGRMFTGVSFLGLMCGALLLVAVLSRSSAPRLRNWRVWLLAAMLALTAIGEFGLQPVMTALREAGLAEGSPEALRFARLHGVSASLYLVTSLLGLALVAFGLRDADAARVTTTA